MLHLLREKKYSACHERGTKKTSESPTGFEPTTSQTPAGALSTWATENSWRARPYTWFIFTVLALSANTTNKDHAVSCEYTKPLVLPHQTQWSQKTEQSPAWDGNNLWKETYKYFSNSSTDSHGVNRRKLQFSLYKPFRSSFKVVHDSVEQACVQLLKYYNQCSCGSALQMPDKNRLESPLGVWTNPDWNGKPPEHFCLLACSSPDFNVKFLNDWSNFDLPKLMPIEYNSFDAWIMVVSC